MLWANFRGRRREKKESNERNSERKTGLKCARSKNGTRKVIREKTVNTYTLLKPGI